MVCLFCNELIYFSCVWDGTSAQGLQSPPPLADCGRSTALYEDSQTTSAAEATRPSLCAWLACQVHPRSLSSAQAIFPSSLSSPFPPSFPSRRPIFHRDCLLGWSGTVDTLEWSWAELTAVPKHNGRCIIDYVCDLTLVLRSALPPPPLPMPMHNFCCENVSFFTS